MIKVIIKESDSINNIEISGHSGYKEIGSDIVCASVSSICITTVNAIINIDSNAIKYKDLDGYLNIDIISEPDVISFDYVEIIDNDEYTIRDCSTENCLVETRTLTTDGTYKILKLEFGSEVYGATKMLKFLTRHGKIVYKNKDQETKEVEINSVINRKYFGKIIFLKVPNDIVDSTNLTLNLKIRNKEYDYKLD